MNRTVESSLTTDLLVVGAGPAGLGAAIQAAGHGARVVVADENSAPGGQLFKQIHKFFGSREHHAGTRGFRIGQMLLEEAERLQVEVLLDTLAWGLFPDNEVALRRRGTSFSVRAGQIVVATGASENSLSFPGSTLPGVMTAGAAQTMCNVHRVLPGRRILMVGTGNVGLIVSYQLMQAGAQVAAVIDAAPAVGGYDVHANKLRRAGVPIHLSHTISAALGRDEVEGAELVALDEEGLVIPGSRKRLGVDTICLAVGLAPRIALLQNEGVSLEFSSCLGGHLPLHDRRMQVRPGLFVAGDVAGIEEASTALEEGRMAGESAARALGLVEEDAHRQALGEIEGRLRRLRSGRFGEKRHLAKEGIIASCGGYTF